MGTEEHTRKDLRSQASGLPRGTADLPEVTSWAGSEQNPDS